MKSFKLFNSPTWATLRRALFRSLVLGILLIAAGGILDLLVNLARDHGSDIPDRFPEILIIFRAVAILTWFEMSIFWVRLAISPKLDSQDIAMQASAEPMSAAVI